MTQKTYRTITCRCRYCGVRATRITNIKDISKIPMKERRFTCNQCMIDLFSQEHKDQIMLFPPKIRF